MTVITNSVRMKLASLIVKSLKQVDEVIKQLQVLMNKRKNEDTILKEYDDRK